MFERFFNTIIFPFSRSEGTIGSDHIKELSVSPK